MRTISRRTQYALKALLALGRRYGQGPVIVATLAAEETVPLKFLEVILLDLKSRGILESKKGKGGGYQLIRPPAAITIGSIIRLMEGPLAPLPCAAESAFKPCEVCRDLEHCRIRTVMSQVGDAISQILDQVTVGDLIAQTQPPVFQQTCARCDPG